MVTALFSDVVGSTTLAESMDPEDWSNVVNETVAVMAQSVERYGGTISQFAGDAIVALFGAPKAHEDDPYRAVRAAIDIISAVRSLSDDRLECDLHVRVGITTGLVIAGDIDAGDLNVYSALGDTLNVASRLQSLAEPDTVLISEATHRLVSSDVDVRLVGPTELKGRSDLVSVYEVVAARGADERTRGIRGLTSPMVGRDDELARLEELLDAAAAGMGRVVAILGEPGVGKSRLTEELGARARGGAALAVGRCVPYDDQLPYHLLASLVRSLAGVSGSDDPHAVERAVVALAEDAGRPATAEHLLRLLGLGEPRPDDTPERLQAAYAESLHGLVSALGADHPPVVLVCEDVHWADASSVALMSALLERAPSTPVLLLLVMRPDRDSGGWSLLAAARQQLGESFTEIRLERLDDAASRLLVGHLLEIESLPPGLRTMVLDKAEGNPFFLEEVVRMLIERDLVERRDGRWVARPGIGRLEVPETVQGLLTSRIDMLPSDVRRAGRVAAVIGRQFSSRLLAAVDPIPGDGGPVATLHPHIAALEAHGMVRLAATRPEPEFAFRHALIHDAMYSGLLKRERRELHREVAAAIEELYPDRVEELAPALARHHAEGGDPERALGYLMAAGAAALSRGARVESHGFYDQAHRVLEASPDADPTLMIDAAIGRSSAGSTFIPGPEAVDSLAGALELAERAGDVDRLAALYVQLIRVRTMQGENYGSHPYREQLDAAYALVPQLADPGTRALLQGMMGQAYRSADELAAAISVLGEAVDGLEAAGRLSDASFNASMLADCLATRGAFADAEVAVARAAHLGQESGDPNAVLDADLISGRIAMERGDLEEALEYTRRSLDAAEAVGNTFCALAGNFLLADQKLRLGDTQEAIGHLERSTGLAQYCHAGGFEALGQAWLTAARARTGSLDPAGFTAPLETAVRAGSRSGEAMVRLQRAMAVAGAGRPQDTFDDFERALALFADYGALPALARAHGAYGRVLHALGRPEDAASHLRRAGAILTELGLNPDPAALR